MKICLITKECFPFYYGGIGSAFYALGRILAQKGHEIVLLTKKPENPDEDILNAHYQHNFSVEWVPYLQNEHSPHFLIDYAFQLERYFEEFNQQFTADLVLYPDFDGEAYFLVREKAKGKYPNTKFVIHYSGPLFCLFGAENRNASAYEKIIFYMEAFCIRNTQFSIAPSRFIQDILTDLFQLDHQYKYVVPNPVNPIVFDQPVQSNEFKAKDGWNIVFVGRLQKTKGADILLQAFASLLAKFPDKPWHLQMIGKDLHWEDYNDSFVQHWKNTLPEIIFRRIEFTEQIAHTELINYLKQATLAVFPSRFETFGNVALEAAYCGVPVLINKNTGLLSITGNAYDFYWSEDEGPEGLAHKMEIALTDKDFLKKLGDRIHERAVHLHNETPLVLADIVQTIENTDELYPFNDSNGDSELFLLVNEYALELVKLKSSELEQLYLQKDEDLKKAWQAYDAKDEELKSLWLAIDQKNEELKDVYIKYEGQIKDAWEKYDIKEQELKNAWQAYDEKDKSLLDVWKKHDEKDQLVSSLQQELETLRQTLKSTLLEIDQIKRSEDYILGQKLNDHNWLRYLLRKL